MKGLLYKNFMSSRLHIAALVFMLLTFGSFIILFAFVATNNMKSGMSEPNTSSITTLVVMTFFMIFFLIEPLSSELFATDEKATTCSFFFSTPQSGKGLLQSKYYFVLLMDLGVLFGCFIIDTILMIVMGEYAVSTLTTCVILFSVMLILMAFRIPCYVRFGSKVGPEVQALYFYGLMCIIVVYGLFGNISFFFEENILEALITYLQSGKVIFVLSFLPYVAILLYYLSYRISLALYRKGVESYE
ncbi:MAG: ABC-2 transporter permease [Lachnospiraceae bacterium]|nr:ABC-2 transporter permease [Lachnospiraceae bacterium]